jgi:hypothetical protein
MIHSKLTSFTLPCRGKFMVGLAAFWMVGSLYSAGDAEFHDTVQR